MTFEKAKHIVSFLQIVLNFIGRNAFWAAVVNELLPVTFYTQTGVLLVILQYPFFE
jgi:hypothetical protein